MTSACRRRRESRCRVGLRPNGTTLPYMADVPRAGMDVNQVIERMSTATETIEGLVQKEYKYGFYTDVEADAAPPGLNEDIIRLISAKKDEPEFMLEWRLKSYRHWLTMK